jgi:hypothetical protein
MILVSKESRQNIQQVLEQAVDYFGPDGVGLELTENGATSVRFQGGGGYVVVRAQRQQDSEMTEVEIESREWDYNAKRFLEEI